MSAGQARCPTPVQGIHDGAGPFSWNIKFIAPVLSWSGWLGPVSRIAARCWAAYWNHQFVTAVSRIASPLVVAG